MLPGFKLTVVGGKDIGRTVEIAGPERTPIKIGRDSPDQSRDVEAIGRTASADRDLILSGDRQVSRVHVKIDAGAGGYLLTDCHSANRTRRNGQLLKPGEPVLLRHNDELRLGPDTLVRFELCQSEQIDTQPPKPPPPEPRPRESSPDSRADRSAKSPPPPPPPPPPSQPPPADSSQGLRGSRADESAEPPVRETWRKFAVFQTLSDGPVVRVHLAIDRDRNERVALKRYARSQLSAKARSALLTCAQKGRVWKHASIAEVLEHGEQGDVIFIASRWIEGKSLRDLQIAYAGDIDIPLALYLTRDLCAALRHGQSVERGFVWRNVNPRNIVVDRDGHAVAVNFGLPSSRSLVDGRDPTDTPEARYLSPEQRRGKETDPRADLYSAGVILYELLARKPVDAGQMKLRDAVGLRDDIPWDVADVANKAVAYQSEKRFIHAADMEEALAAALQKLYPQYASEPAAWIADRLSEPSVA